MTNKKPKAVIKTAKNGEPYIVIKGGNGEPIVNSETYKTKTGIKTAIKALENAFPDIKVEDKTKKTSSNVKKKK